MTCSCLGNQSSFCCRCPGQFVVDSARKHGALLVVTYAACATMGPEALDAETHSRAVSSHPGAAFLMPHNHVFSRADLPCRCNTSGHSTHCFPLSTIHLIPTTGCQRDTKGTLKGQSSRKITRQGSQRRSIAKKETDTRVSNKNSPGYSHKPLPGRSLVPKD